ncbi:MAG: histidine phosphatase family protein [Candidatus Eisenbacteria bacterium]
MIRVLALLRHGLAAGQAPNAELLPEGAAYLRRLGAMLRAEGWAPAAVLTSPYDRARTSAVVMIESLGLSRTPQVLDELVPEGEPSDALAAITAAAPLDSPVLVVAHLPLLGRLVHELVGDDPSFSPGTFVELAREGDSHTRLLRRIGPRDIV